MTRVNADDILESEAMGHRFYCSKVRVFWIWQVDLPLSFKGCADMENTWIIGGMINLLVLFLVWGTVLAGLILIVRDKVEDDDLSQYR